VDSKINASKTDSKPKTQEIIKPKSYLSIGRAFSLTIYNTKNKLKIVNPKKYNAIVAKIKTFLKYFLIFMITIKYGISKMKSRVI
jgi:hypothetical protein